jgi:uncharacterized protein DUF1353
MKRGLMVLAGIFVGAAALSGAQGRFVGKVVVEWLDEPFVPKLQLREDFGFEDPAGKLWLARQGHVLDGASIPPVFRDTIGMPFVGEYRRASIVYDYYCQVMSEPWRDVHRMFYYASLTEGASEVNAKIMYATLYTAGLRWEMPGSRCFSSCHAAAPSLTWKPQVDNEDVTAVVEWIRQANPGLEEIDKRVDATLKKPGPHVFAQGH